MESFIKIFIAFCATIVSCNYSATFACDTFKRKESVTLECKLPGTRQITSCYSGDLPQGTQVNYKCAPNYILANTDIKNGQLSCNSRNRWIGHDRFESFSCSIDCGRQFQEFGPLVVGGIPANRYEWPWHASIFARATSTSPFTYICGGTLVKPYSKGFIIITAAHCLSDARGRARDPGNVKVLLAANYSNWDENNVIPNVQRHEVHQIILHDSYAGSSSDFQADIALISVKRPIEINNNVLPACFSGGADFAELRALGTVVGFGAYEYNNPTVSKTLREAQLPVVEKDKCFEWRERKLLPSEICAGYSNKQSACNGDSGGGYVFPKSFNKVKRFYLEGIVSHGRRNIDNKKEECDSFSVFTRVTSYDSWIRDKAEEMFFEDMNEGQDTFSEEPLPKLSTTTTRTKPTSINNEYRPEVPESPSHHHSARPQLPPLAQPTTSPNNNDFKTIGVERHNYYRRRHGSPPVRLNEKLNIHAQTYAEKLLREGGSLKNEYEEGINKNVYKQSYTQHTNPSPSSIIQSAIDSWYASEKKYDWKNPSYSSFSQVVWKSTTEIGVGLASQRGVNIVVVSYTPPGNLDSENKSHYKENVFPLQRGVGIE